MENSTHHHSGGNGIGGSMVTIFFLFLGSLTLNHWAIIIGMIAGATTIWLNLTRLRREDKEEKRRDQEFKMKWEEYLKKK